MLQLLQPLGLLALGALALPIALHLWRKPARTVRLGSLRFLRNLPARRLRNLRWRERLLLLLRVALLALLALFLAQPHWQPKPSRAPRRWALLDPAAALAGESLDRWQTLARAGYEPRLLRAGFPRISDPSATGTATDSDAGAEDLWSLLREADFHSPAGSKLAVFSPGRMAALRGPRPVMRHCQVEWRQTPPRDGGQPHAWIAQLTASPVLAGARGNGAAVEALIGSSDAAATRFARATSPERNDGQAMVSTPPGWALEVTRQQDGSLAARLAERTGAQVDRRWIALGQTPGLHVVIGQDAGHADEARYVAAAVNAVAANDKTRRIRLETNDAKAVSDRLNANPDAGQPFVFWFSDAPVTPELAQAVAQRGGAMLTEPSATAKGAGDGTHDGWFTAPADAPAAFLLAGSIRLWCRSSPAEHAGVTFWRDGFGQPLLDFAPSGSGGGGQWRFYSRFHPDWNDLPLSGALPAAVEALFSSLAPPPATNHDWRLADPSQCQPAEAASMDDAQAAPAEAFPQNDGTDLQMLFWALTIVAFIAERWLSRRPAPTKPFEPPFPLAPPARQPMEAARS